MCLMICGCDFFQNRVAYSIEQKVVMETEEEQQPEEKKQTENEQNEVVEESSESKSQISDQEEDETAEKSDNEVENKTESKTEEKQTEIPMGDIVPKDQQIIKERKWTILIYMCGDNNLEGAVVNDIFEMETSNLDTDEVNVLMLVDRNPSYSTADDNWTGTRLYRLQTGRKDNQPGFISQEVDCKSLGLICGVETELDMSDSNTLSTALSFCNSKYPAANYGLIMWGHGNGWKGNEFEETENYKGFSYDETSNSYLTLRQFGDALKTSQKNFKLDFVGFDTCYGGELEIMYEIRNYARYACGSEGLISSSGWDYNTLFNEFQNCKDKSILSLMEIIKNQFANQYQHSSRASFIVCELEQIESYFNAFDDFMIQCSRYITSPQERDSVLQCIYASPYCKTERYSYGKEGYDVYLDCISMCENLYLHFRENELKVLYENLCKAEKYCIPINWASDRSFGGLGVYFQTLGPGGLLLTNYDSNYIKGRTYNQIDFVQNSEGYVPTVTGDKSFIDKLFY